jgi:hypothetical protein
VTGQEMPIVEIPSNDSTTITLIEGIPFFCKVAIADKRPPMTLTFKYLSESNEKGSLTIYGSFKEMRPTKKRN